MTLASACGGKKTDGHDQPASPTASPTTAGQAGAPARLCIDPSDIQIEPLDLEALDDEMPPVEPPAAVARVLGELTEHGTLVALDDGGVIVAFVRCPGAAACEAGVMIVEPSGTPRVTRPLPGVDALRPGERLEPVVALADINSQGAPDLWVGYRTGGDATLLRHVAVLSLPGLEVEWHGVVSRSAPPGPGEGCEGTLHAADADCDGDGDIVLVQRCGPMACLGDDSDGCGGAALQSRASIFLWDGTRGAYVERR